MSVCPSLGSVGVSVGDGTDGFLEGRIDRRTAEGEVEVEVDGTNGIAEGLAVRSTLGEKDGLVGSVLTERWTDGTVTGLRDEEGLKDGLFEKERGTDGWTDRSAVGMVVDGASEDGRKEVGDGWTDENPVDVGLTEEGRTDGTEEGLYTGE